MKIKECYSTDIVKVKGRKWVLGPMVDFMPDHVQVYEIDPVDSQATSDDEPHVLVLDLEQDIEEVIQHGFDQQISLNHAMCIYSDILDGMWVPLGQALQREQEMNELASRGEFYECTPDEHEILHAIQEKAFELGLGMLFEEPEGDSDDQA